MDRKGSCTLVSLSKVYLSLPDDMMKDPRRINFLPPAEVVVSSVEEEEDPSVPVVPEADTSDRSDEGSVVEEVDDCEDNCLLLEICSPENNVLKFLLPPPPAEREGE